MNSDGSCLVFLAEESSLVFPICLTELLWVCDLNAFLGKAEASQLVDVKTFNGKNCPWITTVVLEPGVDINQYAISDGVFLYLPYHWVWLKALLCLLFILYQRMFTHLFGRFIKGNLGNSTSEWFLSRSLLYFITAGYILRSWQLGNILLMGNLLLIF